MRARSQALALALVACLALTTDAMAQEPARQFALECALKDIAVFTLIEDHGAAGDVAGDQLGDAVETMLRARAACYEGRIGEAMALYDRIFDLKPVASLRRQAL